MRLDHRLARLVAADRLGAELQQQAGLLGTLTVAALVPPLPPGFPGPQLIAVLVGLEISVDDQRRRGTGCSTESDFDNCSEAPQGDPEGHDQGTQQHERSRAGGGTPWGLSFPVPAAMDRMRVISLA